ncbi:MAG: hypothetical protein RLZZ245_2286 [Verrucomicrobiota bacterium]|jgi:hypothetical protein
MISWVCPFRHFDAHFITIGSLEWIERAKLVLRFLCVLNKWVCIEPCHLDHL